MRHIMAIDQGTSSSRAIIFDPEGNIVGVGQQPFDMIFPADGWVEQDPEVLWQTTLAAGRDPIHVRGDTRQIRHQGPQTWHNRNERKKAPSIEGAFLVCDLAFEIR